MKSFKNIFPLAAFVLAVTAAFAFTPVKATKLGLINVQAQNYPICTPGQVSDQCTSVTSGSLCKMFVFPALLNVVPQGGDCLNAAPLRNPNLR